LTFPEFYVSINTIEKGTYIMSSVIYNKENIYKEFDVAKQKDIELSDKKTPEEKENDIHTNRLQFCKDHKELNEKDPGLYDCDIKWDSLITAYSSPNPRDHFYKSVFGRTYAEQMAFETSESESDDGGEDSYYRSRRKNRNYKR
jgi:hypothetical protein